MSALTHRADGLSSLYGTTPTLARRGSVPASRALFNISGDAFGNVAACCGAHRATGASSAFTRTGDVVASRQTGADSRTGGNQSTGRITLRAFPRYGRGLPGLWRTRCAYLCYQNIVCGISITICRISRALALAHHINVSTLVFAFLSFLILRTQLMRILYLATPPLCPALPCRITARANKAPHCAPLRAYRGTSACAIPRTSCGAHASLLSASCRAPAPTLQRTHSQRAAYLFLSIIISNILRAATSASSHTAAAPYRCGTARSSRSSSLSPRASAAEENQAGRPGGVIRRGNRAAASA